MGKWISLLGMVIVLFGCSDDARKPKAVDAIPVSGSSSNIQTESANTTNQNISDTISIQVEKKFTFSKFSLDIDYANNQTYELDYEKNSNRIEAEIEDERINKKVIGKKAYNMIIPELNKLTFDKYSSDADVKREILTVFNINENYKKIEIEVRFADGADKEYRFNP
ncbi:YusW family protein [Rummeliibacillus sp. JY-2-4R]